MAHPQSESIPSTDPAILARATDACRCPVDDNGLATVRAEGTREPGHATPAADGRPGAAVAAEASKRPGTDGERALWDAADATRTVRHLADLGRYAAEDPTGLTGSDNRDAQIAALCHAMSMAAVAAGDLLDKADEALCHPAVSGASAPLGFQLDAGSKFQGRSSWIRD